MGNLSLSALADLIRASLRKNQINSNYIFKTQQCYNKASDKLVAVFIEAQKYLYKKLGFFIVCIEEKQLYEI